MTPSGTRTRPGSGPGSGGRHDVAVPRETRRRPLQRKPAPGEQHLEMPKVHLPAAVAALCGMGSLAAVLLTAMVGRWTVGMELRAVLARGLAATVVVLIAGWMLGRVLEAAVAGQVVRGPHGRTKPDDGDADGGAAGEAGEGAAGDDAEGDDETRDAGEDRRAEAEASAESGAEGAAAADTGAAAA